MRALSLIFCLFASNVYAVPPDWWLVVSCKTHDLDTWTDATVEIPHINQQLVRRSFRLHDCDACEVDYTRQPTLTRQKAKLITVEEIAKGKEGTDKLNELAAGGKRYVRIINYDADYNRHEAELKIVTKKGVEIDVKEWIKANGYERPQK